MKNKTKKEKTGRIKTESSMSYASKPICQEAECIGKVTVPPPADAAENGRKKVGNKKHTTRSSMKFGKKDACRDEACIAET